MLRSVQMGETAKKNGSLEALIMELESINDPWLRKEIIDLVLAAPKWFFTIGASKTGQHHPQYAQGEGGLLRHTVATIKLAKILSGVAYLQLSEYQKDAYIAAAAIHDLHKYGTSDEPDAKIGRNHGFSASQLITGTHPFIADIVRTHMGEFGPSKPRTIHQFMLHVADLLASRPNIVVTDAAEMAEVQDILSLADEKEEGEQ